MSQNNDIHNSLELIDLLKYVCRTGLKPSTHVSPVVAPPPPCNELADECIEEERILEKLLKHEAVLDGRL